MHQLLLENKHQILQLCKHFNVKTLVVFGSATSGAFDESSDVDFLVRFDESLPASVYSSSYFALLEGLEKLLDRKVDLLTADSIRNPYLLASIASSQELLYAA